MLLGRGWPRAVPSLLPLHMGCMPCTASLSHAAWDVDRPPNALLEKLRASRLSESTERCSLPALSPEDPAGRSRCSSARWG
jgi:hypothetical protein